MSEQKVDIAFVTETWILPDRSIPASCREYSAICSNIPPNRFRGANGVSLIVRRRPGLPECLSHVQVLARDSINGLYLLVKIGNIKFLAIYAPPDMADFITWLNELCNSLDILPSDVMEIGMPAPAPGTTTTTTQGGVN